MSKPSNKEVKRRERLQMLDLSAMGLVFPVAMVLGYYAGREIGGWWGADRSGALIGLLVGVLAGFYNVYKMIARLNRQDAATRGEDGSGRSADGE